MPPMLRSRKLLGQRIRGFGSQRRIGAFAIVFGHGAQYGIMIDNRPPTADDTRGRPQR